MTHRTGSGQKRQRKANDCVLACGKLSRDERIGKPGRNVSSVPVGVEPRCCGRTFSREFARFLALYWRSQ